MLSDLKRIIDQISRDKGIDRQLLVEALEEAVLSAAKKRYGIRRDIEVNFNDDFGEIELFQFRLVVEQVEDDQTQVKLEEALKLDPDVQLGDELGSKMDDVSDLGRIAAQSAKQVIIQKMKEAERDVIFEMYKDRKGEIVNGIVQRFERGNMIINLGRTDAILFKKEQMPRRSYRQGDRIRAYLLDVRQDVRDQQLVLSRTNKEFLVKLFEMEVPEISEGIVSIINACREPGLRAKIAVSSSEIDVDPVGACVGMKGSRVQNVVQELQGEKIDIVPWSPDPAKYVSNALAPAQVSMVVVDEDKKTLLVIVPDDQLSLAIGRQGQNVRLASQLLGWRIDVKSEQRYSRMMEEGFKSLMLVPEMTEKMAEALYDADIVSSVDLIKADPAVVAEVTRLNEEAAEALCDAAGNVTQSGSIEDEDVDAAPDSVEGAGDDSEDSSDAVGNMIQVDDSESEESEESATADLGNVDSEASSPEEQVETDEPMETDDPISGADGEPETSA